MARVDKSQYVTLELDKLHPNTELPIPVFVYMPDNDKMLSVLKADSVLPSEKLEQWKKSEGRFFIRKSDVAALEEFLKKPPVPVPTQIERLLKGSGQEVSKNELQLKSAELLFKHLNISIDKSSKLTPVEQAQQHIQTVVNQVFEVLEVESGILEKVKELQESMRTSQWDHSLNVSAISALLALSVGYTDKKLLRDIASGGYLHDIGLAFCNVSPRKRLLSYQAEELERYKQHPTAGLEMVEMLGLDVSEEVKLIIYQHEELYDGTGYPQGLKGVDIFEPAHIVGIASQFDHLIRVDQPGWLAPEEAIRKLGDMNMADASPHSPMLLLQIFQSAFSADAVKME